MSKEQMLQLIKLLSVVEVLLVQRSGMPDYTYEEISSAIETLQREILK